MKKGAKGNSKGLNININLSNRWLYTLIAIGILAIVGVAIYADAPSSTIPNPGHSISQLQTCDTVGDILQMNSSGQWGCVNMSSSTNIPSCSQGQFIQWINGVWQCYTLQIPSMISHTTARNSVTCTGGNCNAQVSCSSGYQLTGCTGGLVSSAWGSKWQIQSDWPSTNYCSISAQNTNNGDSAVIDATCAKLS